MHSGRRSRLAYQCLGYKLRPKTMQGSPGTRLGIAEMVRAEDVNDVSRSSTHLMRMTQQENLLQRSFGTKMIPAHHWTLSCWITSQQMSKATETDLFRR